MGWPVSTGFTRVSGSRFHSLSVARSISGRLLLTVRTELEVDVPVMKILGGGSIAEIVEHAIKAFSDKS